jgi:O-antigen/teichoic acid export membrane protein
LGAFYFLVRVLDKQSFGVWCLFMGTTTLIEFARNGLVNNALIKYLASANSSDHGKILSASFTLAGILTAIGIIMNCSLAHWLSVIWHWREVEYLFYWYNIAFIITGVINQFNSIQQAMLNFKGTFLSSLIGSSIFFIYILVAYAVNMHPSLSVLLIVQILSSVVALIISLINTRKIFLFKEKPDWHWVKTLLNYGKFSFGTIISAMIFSSIDQWMLGVYISAAAAGAFSIAIRVANMVEVPTNSIAAIVFPQSARRISSEGMSGAKYLYERSVGTILALIIPALAILFSFSQPIVHIIAGDEYPESVQILRVAILYCLLLPFGRQFGTILDSIGKPKLNFYTVLISALCNIILNYFLINSLGIIGAAYATLISSIVNFALCQFILRRTLHISITNTLMYALAFYPDFFRKYFQKKSPVTIPDIVIHEIPDRP